MIRYAITAFCLCFSVAAFAKPVRSPPVTVDAGHLRALGAGSVVDGLARYVAEGAQEVMALQTSPARRIIRLTGLSFAASIGDDDWLGGGGDALEGEVLLLDAQGRVIERRPLLFKQPASGGAWYSPFYDEQRLRTLGLNFGRWAGR